VICLRRPTF